MEYFVSDRDLELAAGNLQEVFERHKGVRSDEWFLDEIVGVAYAMFSENELVDEVINHLIRELEELRKEDREYA